MLENRYDDILRIGNREILKLVPSNVVLREELAREVQQVIRRPLCTVLLELGSGEGDLTRFILDYSLGKCFDAVDISPEMIACAKEYLGKDAYKVRFICEDALEYLMEISAETLELITFAFFIHNFKKDEQKKMFEQIYRILKYNGTMIIMEKIYPDDPWQCHYLFNIQMRRYSTYLEKELADTIIEHETQDVSSSHLMMESETISLLKEVGFRHVEIKDRVESVVLLTACK